MAAAASTAPAAHPDRVLILDFGSQVTQLIARRVREAGIYCEIIPFSADEARIRAFAPKAIILSGGPASVTEAGSPRAHDVVWSLGVPVFGICYGQQTMCEQLGGKVEPGDTREFGRAFVDVKDDCALFEGVWSIGAREQVWMSHGDRVTKLPDGFRIVATRGTARALLSLGVHVEFVNKVTEGGRTIVDWISEGLVDLIINTPYGREARSDGFEIRQAASQRGVPCITTLAGASAAVSAIEASRRPGISVHCLQDLHERIGIP